jgi:hypothetical protein
MAYLPLPMVEPALQPTVTPPSLLVRYASHVGAGRSGGQVREGAFDGADSVTYRVCQRSAARSNFAGSASAYRQTSSARVEFVPERAARVV